MKKPSMLKLKLIYIFWLFTGLVVSSVSLGNTAADIYRKIQPSVYRVILVKENNDEKHTPVLLGSAVVIARNLLLTNCHVVKKSLDYDYIIITNREQEYFAVPVDGDFKKDICILYARANLKAIPIKLVEKVKVGDLIYALGSPGMHNNLFTDGIVSGFAKHAEKGKLIKFTAYINEGSSGGGLFDKNGNLIGITTGSIDKVNYAVSLDWVKENLPYLDGPQKPHIIHMESEDKQFVNSTADESASFHVIGIYGKNKVGLYKTNLGCVIRMIGVSRRGSKISSAYWFPDFPRLIFYYPYSTNINSVIRNLEQVRSADGDSLVYSGTKDFIMLDSKAVPLIQVDNQMDSSNTLHFANLNSSPLYLFSKGSFFVTNFISKSKIFYFPIYFGLYGFDDAHDDYIKYCK